MRMMERLYRSVCGRGMSAVARFLARVHQPFMVYGFVDPVTKQFRKYTRMSSSAVVMNAGRLGMGDHVWVWHYSILDATEGITIGEGCQIGAWVGIFTHGSENAIRLLGRRFVHIASADRAGYTRGAVVVGPYTFIGAGAVILPGTTIGKGCLIAAGALVRGDIADYTVVVGNPAVCKGRTVDLDRRFFRQRDFTGTYYDAEALQEIKSRMQSVGGA